MADERAGMATPEERAENEALLAWLRSGSAHGLDPDEQRVKQYLLQGKNERQPLDDLTRTLLPPTRKATGRDIRQARGDAEGWRSLGYDAEDVRPWLRAGLEPADHDLAGDLVAEGITPQRAGEQFKHPRTGELVTIIDVARNRYRMTIDRTYAFASLNDALDDAGIERVKQPRPSRLFGRRGSRRGGRLAEPGGFLLLVGFRVSAGGAQKASSRSRSAEGESGSAVKTRGTSTRPGSAEPSWSYRLPESRLRGRFRAVRHRWGFLHRRRLAVVAAGPERRCGTPRR